MGEEAMTPREPDRFSVQAKEFCLRHGIEDGKTHSHFAAALRQAESSALERAAREGEALSSNYNKDRALIADSIADAIRALIPPAAAPAAETGKGPSELDELRRELWQARAKIRDLEVCVQRLRAARAALCTGGDRGA
jgi:hypothetical protein